MTKAVLDAALETLLATERRLLGKFMDYTHEEIKEAADEIKSLYAKVGTNALTNDDYNTLRTMLGFYNKDINDMTYDEMRYLS
ncbi:hypothetical protein MYO4S_00082 [Serratia phage 4S]|nr:hypothetical protein MYO4S_00082 [Serratia phage 4S]